MTNICAVTCNMDSYANDDKDESAGIVKAGIVKASYYQESRNDGETQVKPDAIKHTMDYTDEMNGMHAQPIDDTDRSTNTDEVFNDNINHGIRTNVDIEAVEQPIVLEVTEENAREPQSSADEVLREYISRSDQSETNLSMDTENNHAAKSDKNNNKHNLLSGDIMEISVCTADTCRNDDFSLSPEKECDSWLPQQIVIDENSDQPDIELNEDGTNYSSCDKSNNNNDMTSRNNEDTKNDYHVCIFPENETHDCEVATHRYPNTEETVDKQHNYHENIPHENNIQLNVLRAEDYTLWKFINSVQTGDTDVEVNRNSGEDIGSDRQDTSHSDTENNDSNSEIKKAAEEVDPWKLPEVTIDVTPWNELSRCQKIRRVTWGYVGKCILLLVCLYFFVCSLDLLSNSFRLLGGKTAGSVFKNSALLGNPVAGLMMGVLTTALLQSSSTTTGIAISMVVAGVMDVREVIPIVMGANIGTSITNTLVSMGQITDRADFRRAFAGATVHDMFNWLSVLVLLPVEVATGYLFRLTKAIVSAMTFPTQGGKKKRQQFLKTITKPFTNLIIKIDKQVLEEMALGRPGALDRSIIRHCCRTGIVSTCAWNSTGPYNTSYWGHNKTCIQSCNFMFESVSNYWSDSTVGVILLLLTLILITACFITLVRTIYSMLRGQILVVLKRFVNSDFPGRWSFLTGYLAIIIGTGTTMIVQSSSVVTSSLTPLVGMGLVSIERMYPLTLGANLGTTFTAIIIAFSQSAEDMPVAFHVALCHMFFNISGVLIFYPIPHMRIPIKLAKFLGNETAKYRWFGIVYMIAIFVVFPAVIFALSTVSWIVLVCFAVPCVGIAVTVLTVSIMQTKAPELLPRQLRTWTFLPSCLRSLEPYDNVMTRVLDTCRCCCCSKKGKGDIKSDNKLTLEVK